MLALLTAIGAALARLALTGLAVDTLLGMAGASEIKFIVAQASPWRVVIEDLDFRLRAQAYGAKRLVVQRAHWWTPSLGSVRVEQVRVPVTIDGSDTNPWAPSTYKHGPAGGGPARIPADEITIDGQLIVQAATPSGGRCTDRECESALRSCVASASMHVLLMLRKWLVVAWSRS